MLAVPVGGFTAVTRGQPTAQTLMAVLAHDPWPAVPSGLEIPSMSAQRTLRADGGRLNVGSATQFHADGIACDLYSGG